ncbi:MAG: FAD binding domain-containing protein [Thermodesulfobacteriota bacterium]
MSDRRMMKFDYHQPKSVAEALQMMQEAKGLQKYVAGGTDLIVRMKQRLVRPAALVSLRGIESLRFIRTDSDGGMTLGSMTLLRDIERNERIKDTYPVLWQAVGVLANPQVRNVATLGGNVVNSAPSADCGPPLLVLGAIVVLEGPNGRREVPVDRFFTGPRANCMSESEILTEIKLPPVSIPRGMAFEKMGRVNQDIAVVNAAAFIEADGQVCRRCRLAVGAVAPIPLRLMEAERLVDGERVTQGLLERLARAVEREVRPITDVRATEAYRRVISGVLVKRAVVRALNQVQ